MADINTDAAKLGLFIGGAALALLFFGQMLSFAARWAGRALSGAAFLLIAVGLGYVIYQLYTGWSMGADDSDLSMNEMQFGATSSEQGMGIEDTQEQYINNTFNEQELEEELENLMQDESAEGDMTREAE